MDAFKNTHKITSAMDKRLLKSHLSLKGLWIYGLNNKIVCYILFFALSKVHFCLDAMSIIIKYLLIIYFNIAASPSQIVDLDRYRSFHWNLTVFAPLFFLLIFSGLSTILCPICRRLHHPLELFNSPSDLSLRLLDYAFQELLVTLILRYQALDVSLHFIFNKFASVNFFLQILGLFLFLFDCLFFFEK